MHKNVLNDFPKWQTKQQSHYSKISTPCLDYHQFKNEDLGTVGELSVLYLVRIGRPDMVWTVKYLTRHMHEMEQGMRHATTQTNKL